MKKLLITLAIAASFTSCVKSDNKYFTCHYESIFEHDSRYKDDSIYVNPSTTIEYATSTYSGDTMYNHYTHGNDICYMRYYQICTGQ